MEVLWESENFIGDSTLTVNITRVRNKLEELGLKELLETKRGQGYILKRGIINKLCRKIILKQYYETYF